MYSYLWIEIIREAISSWCSTDTIGLNRHSPFAIQAPFWRWAQKVRTLYEIKNKAERYDLIIADGLSSTVFLSSLREKWPEARLVLFLGGEEIEALSGTSRRSAYLRALHEGYISEAKPDLFVTDSGSAFFKASSIGIAPLELLRAAPPFVLNAKTHLGDKNEILLPIMSEDLTPHEAFVAAFASRLPNSVQITCINSKRRHRPIKGPLNHKNVVWINQPLSVEDAIFRACAAKAVYFLGPENLSRAQPFISSCHVSGAIIAVSDTDGLRESIIPSETACLLPMDSAQEWIDHLLNSATMSHIERRQFAENNNNLMSLYEQRAMAVSAVFEKLLQSDHLTRDSLKITDAIPTNSPV